MLWPSQLESKKVGHPYDRMAKASFYYLQFTVKNNEMLVAISHKCVDILVNNRVYKVLQKLRLS